MANTGEASERRGRGTEGMGGGMLIRSSSFDPVLLLCLDAPHLVPVSLDSTGTVAIGIDAGTPIPGRPISILVFLLLALAASSAALYFLVAFSSALSIRFF